MRELLERFRYRFDSWWREQREDSFGAGGTRPVQEPRDTSHYRDPRNAAIITESTARLVFRIAIVFSGGIAILAILIYGLMAIVWPSPRHAADIVMAVLGAVWSLGIGFTALDICVARRTRREQRREEI